MLFLVGTLRADSQPPSTPPPAPAAVPATPDKGADRAATNPTNADEMLKRFDRNGDGRLDEDERAEAHERMMKEQLERRDDREQAEWKADARKKILEGFDRNHDGRLDGAERDQARAVIDEIAADASKPPAPAPAAPAGKLGKAERKELRKALQNGDGARVLRQEILNRFDRDGNGRIDDAEWVELEPVLRRRIEAAPRQTERYDRNRDGRLDDAEWNSAAATIRAWLNGGEPPPESRGSS
jgi:Ca2+-binding EF-hand superfamily protein